MKNVDQRIRKTRAALHGAMSSLLIEKHPGEISVRDILETADVARSTFYTHFLDKHDVAASFAAQFRAELKRCCKGAGSTPFAFSRELFRRCYEHQELLRAISSRQPCAMTLRSWFNDLICELVREDFSNSRYERSSPLDQEALVQCIAGALNNLIFWALAQERTYVSDELDSIFQALVAPRFTKAPV
jgi:AcrR family transcriptional regulator